MKKVIALTLATAMAEMGSKAYGSPLTSTVYGYPQPRANSGFKANQRKQRKG